MLLSLLAPFALSVSSIPQQDWPHIRGPHLDGRVEGANAFGSGEFGLRVAWRREIGPAYAGIAVGEGCALTTYSDGEVDRVIALDAESGAERWQHVLGPTYRGHDGSEDGTISSPVIGGEAAYVITALGQLLALRLDDGGVIWTKDLVAELGAMVPEYGFTSTPLVVGTLLVVQAGGEEGRLLCGLELATGELIWSMGEVATEYTSPILMDLAGRRQLVVPNGKEILGVAPENGELLWTHTLTGERDAVETGMATAMDDDGFFVNVSGTIVVFRVSVSGEGFAVEESVRIRELGRTYAPPVYQEGRLWGFRSDFLTCVDADSGKRLWKSRPPGGRGLILVDGRLVIYGAQGIVAVAEASDEEYVELARIEALDSTGYTWPSFADGRIYLRNSKELSCIGIVKGPAEAATAALSGIDGSAEWAKRIEALWAEHETMPVVEGNRVFFLFQGEVEDVAIAGNMIDGSKPEPLHRVGETDLYYRVYEIEPGARWEYRFQIDYDEWRADPRNPRTVPAAWGAPMSVVATPGYPERTHYLPSPDGPKGRLEPLSFTSEALGNTRDVGVYLPHGYDTGTEAYPLLIVHEGKEWLEKGGVVHSLDYLTGKSVRPMVVAFVTPIEEWWYEGGGTGTEEYLDMLAEEFVPFLEERYRLSKSPQDRALLGKESFGMTAVVGALRRPETFGKAAVQSMALGDRARHTLFDLLEREERQDLSFYIGWNRYAGRNKDGGYDYRAESQRVFEALKAKGYPVAGGEALDGYGWGSLSARMDELLEALFPSE